ncbi:MAG: RNA methyltransferase [Pseudomonadota bacterium]
MQNIRIVLVNTSHPGNIGAAARAMKNMGLERLYLVQPREFPHEEATARASGADDILARAKVCSTLEEALTGCSLTFGSSARRRYIAWPQVNARECATLVAQQPLESEIALVFGREQTGLHNEELDRCNYLVHIPCNPDFSSLNVASAVQVLSYELRMQTLEGEAAAKPDQAPLATTEEIERMFNHFEQVLVKIGFMDPENPRLVMRRLRRLFNRTGLEKVEINILRGILTEMENAIKNK